jgi:TRAP-type C4-dicarboxylate transport system permease small subunit
MAVAESLCAACILAIAVIVMYEVVVRTVFNAPTTWGQEVAVYLLLAAAFLGFAPTLAAGQHIRIDILSSRFGPRTQAVLECMFNLAIAAFAALVVWGGSEMLLQSFRFGRKSLTLLEVPVWIPQLLIPVGGCLLLISALHGAWRSTGNAGEGFTHA